MAKVNGDNVNNINDTSFVTCTICFEQLREPRRDSCNHVFCKTCYLVIGNRTCPMCRRHMDLLMVDTVQDPLEEAYNDFASHVIMKKRLIRRPVIVSSLNELDYMLLEDHHNLGRQSTLTEIFVVLMILYCFLLEVVSYVLSPPFRLFPLVFVGLVYLALFCILYLL